MSNWITPESQQRHAQAGALATALAAKGHSVVIHKTGGHALHPCIQVTADRTRPWFGTEFIYLAPDDDGQWWFWWSSLDRIAPATEISVAAAMITRELPLASRMAG